MSVWTAPLEVCFGSHADRFSGPIGEGLGCSQELQPMASYG